MRRRHCSRGLVGGLCLFASFTNAQSPANENAPAERPKIVHVEEATLHPHFETRPHPTTHDAARFNTTRQSAIDLPLPEESDAFTFAVFGDRTGGPPEGIEVLKQAVADVNLLEPDLVMTVGDLIQGYNDTASWLPQMREYKAVMGELFCPWFPVAGNHDVYWRGENPPVGEHEANYEMHFGPLWYAFEHKNSWFIVLFSDEGNPNGGPKTYSQPDAQRMSPEQFAWLKETLSEASDAEHVFLFLHHPRWLGGGYGDDWKKVHRTLVEAGNVRAVFAGHIHRMRYDGPRDGIEYVTLATVGGGQNGAAPGAGLLHHFHLITVRPQQIAMACLPLGEVMDVREITGELSEEVLRLAREGPSFRNRPTLSDEGRTNEPLVVEMFNPTRRPVEYELVVDSADHLWTAQPDHVHRTVYPGQRITTPVRLHRRTAVISDGYQQPELIVRADYLAEHARVGVREQRVTAPIRIDLPAPETPGEERAVRVDADRYLAVDSAAIQLPDGPFTIECWCKGRNFGDRIGLVGKAQDSGYGLFAGSRQPEFSVFLGDRFVEARAVEPLLEVGRWSHVAGVYDGQQIRLYVDGELAASQQASGKRRTNNLPLIIGGDVDPNGRNTAPFDGWVDGVRLSKMARYEGQQFTPQRRPTADDQTLLLLNFDDFTGPFTYDGSGRMAHARRVGAVELSRTR